MSISSVNFSNAGAYQGSQVSAPALAPAEESKSQNLPSESVVLGGQKDEATAMPKYLKDLVDDSAQETATSEGQGVALTAGMSLFTAGVGAVVGGSLGISFAGPIGALIGGAVGGAWLGGVMGLIGYQIEQDFG